MNPFHLVSLSVISVPKILITHRINFFTPLVNAPKDLSQSAVDKRIRAKNGLILDILYSPERFA